MAATQTFDWCGGTDVVMMQGRHYRYPDPSVLEELMRATSPYRAPQSPVVHTPGSHNRPPAARHERIEDHHLAIAHLVHETLAASDRVTALDVEDAATPRLTGVIDMVLTELYTVRREFEALLRDLPAEYRRTHLRAIALLSRAHDEAWRDVHEAQVALDAGSLVSVRIRLARLFASIGRAEQMHYYLRTARQPSE